MMMTDRGNGVRTRMQGSRFQVATPYTPSFISVAHALKGRWRPRSHVWSFPRSNYAEVARELNRIFGTTLPNCEEHEDAA